MSREWKPGDVAMVTFAGIGGDPETAIGICYHGGPVSRGSTSGVARWRLGDGTDVWSSAIEARPLVVIDPEDREAVERLQDLFADERERNGGQSRFVVGGWADATQAALRKYANPTPPKPDEPQGLGAVVEDEDGYLYVRGYVNGESTHEWHVIDPASNKRMGWWKYDEIAAVRVLSPGVEVDQ